MVQVNRRRLTTVKLFDLIARIIITLGGILVITSVIVIVLLIVGVTFPLFGGADASLRVVTTLPEGVNPDDVLRLGIDLVEIGEGARTNDALSGYALTKDGEFVFFEFVESAQGRSEEDSGVRVEVLSRKQLQSPAGTEGATVAFVDQSAGSEYTMLWSDGAVSVVEAAANAQFDEIGRRSVEYLLKERAALEPEGEGTAVKAVARPGSEGSSTCAILQEGNRIVVRREKVETGLFGEGEKSVTRSVIASDILPGPVSAMTVNREGNTLFVGTRNGHLGRFRLDAEGKIVHQEIVSVPGKPEITALTMVFGDVSLAVGGSDGSVTTWFPVRTVQSESGRDLGSLTLIHELSPHPDPVAEIIPSQRNKTLLSVGRAGDVHLDYMTSEKHLLTLGSERPLNRISYSPRGNAVVALDEEQRLLVWQIDSPHPEISWNTLFGKVWYENHERPKYMWQSSGTDEPKLSLVPVIFGTLKATFYAMLFAVPLALFSAMYVSHFTMPSFKRTIKPVVEVMAAIPTVVIGFLILLWAAPLVGRWIVGVFAAFLTIPVTFVVAMILWQGIRRFEWARRVESGYEFLALVPVILVGSLIGIWLTGPLEQSLFGGDFRQWLFDERGVRYDQLNSLVVAFGLGFAVIPIIFSISEDSLSDIPYSLTAASLALGASRWQTVWRVVLPSASPGIFAAVMIGFGRAVGETMIVFMATGNTPILDWSPFNGFRTLSANIAVEISEAPRNGTLYRVLFLCAVILFLMTFVLNTAAEVVRVRLRKKYGRY